MSRHPLANLPSYVLGVALRKLVDAGRLSQDGAITIAMLATPESCWGNNCVDIESAIERAVSPKRARRIWGSDELEDVK